MPSGYLIFYHDNTLFAQAFNPDKLTVSGEAVPLLTDVTYTPRIARAVFAASDRTLMAQRGSETSISRLVWYDRKGAELGAVAKPDNYANIALSRDGQTVLLDKTDEGSQNTDIWTYDLRRESLKRLTFDPAIDSMATFSPSGSQVLFSSSRDHYFRVYLKNADGAEQERPLIPDDSGKIDRYPCDWSRDGKNILLQQVTELWVA